METEIDTDLDTEVRTRRTIAARELKRRGIGFLDDHLVEGPVHVIRNDKLSYVIMTEAQYQDFLDDAEVASMLRIKQSLKDYDEGRFKVTSAEELIRELNLE